tara:strand:- start:372 stop:1064 length:693 start_codon:yes stop_codon:yes gene_type:complete
MSLKSDIENKVKSYFTEPYTVEDTKIVPDTDYSKLTFGNKGLKAELAFLFVDIRKSSEMHTTYGFADTARIYQSFHDICIRIIESKDGKIRAFDGDRIMGVFSGEHKCSNATQSARKIKWAIQNILNQHLKIPIKIGIGIDFGNTLIAKVGKGRDTNNNDLDWIGQACNYASHLSGYGKDTTLITSRTYNRMNENSKFYNGKSMWSEKKLTIKNGKEIDVYESNWGFIVD